MAADHTDMVWDEDLPWRSGRRSAADSMVADRVAFGRGTDKNFVATADQTFEIAVGRAAHYGSALERRLLRIVAPLSSEVERVDSIARVSADCILEMRLSYGSDHDRKGHSLTEPVALALGRMMNVPWVGIPADRVAAELSRRGLQVD